MAKTLVLAFVSILLLVAGQSFLKYGLTRVGGVNFAGGQVIAGLRTIVGSPHIVAGFIFYGLSSLIWLDVLSKLELSYAFPLVSLTYVFTLFVGGVFFGEAITWTRIAGVLVIISGVVLVARS